MWSQDFYAPDTLELKLRVWGFYWRRLQKALAKFGIERVVLPPVYGVKGTELADVGGYWKVQTPWFTARMEVVDAEGRNI